MINIKVIDVKKYCRFMCIFVTFLMMLLSFKILLFKTTEEYRVKADEMMETTRSVQTEENSIKNRLFILILNKGIPVLEVANRDEYGDSTYTQLLKLAVTKLINFDYEDPKTFLNAQIPAFEEANEKLALEQAEKEAQQETTGELTEVNAPQPSDPLDNPNETPIEEEPQVTPIEEITPQNVDPETGQSTQATEGSAPAETSIGSVEIVSSSAQRPSKIKLDMNKPTIFVYHTHGTESYLPVEEGNFRSLEKRNYTVREVGDQLTAHLKDKKYQVIHDDTIHDYPSFGQSYIRALETLKKNLSKNKSLKIVFDVHRDAIIGQKQSFITIKDEKVATCKLVIGGKNDNVEQLRVFAKYIKAKSDEMYPGLISVIIEKDYAKFNQYNSDYYALIEVGNITNHIEEAVNSTKYLTEVIDAVIKDIKE